MYEQTFCLFHFQDPFKLFHVTLEFCGKHKSHVEFDALYFRSINVESRTSVPDEKKAAGGEEIKHEYVSA